MAAVNKILVAICVIQFGIISLWVSTPPSGVQNNWLAVQSPSPTLPAINEISPAIPACGSIDGPIVSGLQVGLSQRDVPLIPHAGVAAVVMLHSPKWFQRRYTMMIQNIYNNMPRGWVVQIFYINEGGSKLGLEINPGIEKLRKAGKVVLTEMPRHVWYKKKRRSDYFLIPWLWENMLADKVLLFGGNTVLCSNSPLTVDNFTHFDYIGSPWGKFEGNGGSGEVSLRTRSVMLRVINAQLAKKNISEGFTDVWGMEDNFFVRNIIELIHNGYNLKIAMREDTERFAASNGVSSLNVFSASGTLAGLTDQGREDFFAYCPEIKVIFPSLHNPGCFGANLKKEECAKSICALRPEKKSC